MQTVSYEEGQKLLQRHVCAMCGGRLLLPWGGSYGVDGYVLVCALDSQHEGTVKERSLTDHYESGESLPVFITQRIERRRQKEMEKALAKRDQAVGEYLGGKLTKEQASYLIESIWPKAPQVEVVKAAILCARYGLDPLMKHVFLVPFTGKDGTTWERILGIRATRLIARQHVQFGYIGETPRIMTNEEQERRRGKIDTENIWAITVLVDTNGFQYPGYGVWPKSKAAYGADKGNTPENMAMIRSERAAIDKLCPGLLPEGVDVGEEAYIETGNFEDVVQPENTPASTAEPPPAASQRLTGGKNEEVTVKVETLRVSGEDIRRFGQYLKDRNPPLDAKDLPKTEYLGSTLHEWLKDGKTVDQAIELLDASKADTPQDAVALPQD